MKIRYNIPFQLFASCIPVKGYTRSTICDIQKNSYVYIPNSLYDIIDKYEGCTLDEIFSKFNKNEKKILDEYFSFLHNNDLIFFTKNISNFPKIEERWEHPSNITNSIIDINYRYSEFNYIKIINELSELGCKALQIRLYNNVPEHFLIKLLSFDSNNKIRDVQVVMKFNNYSKKIFAKLYEINPRLSSIKVHSSPFSKSDYLNDSGLYEITFSDKELLDSSACGCILPSHFNVNIDLLMESKQFNSCLNRKVGIDENGEIKNCPSLKKSFGNVKFNNISEIVSLEGFKELWFVKKDLIDECKDCEFRYICTDCRFSSSTTFHKYSKPEKCTYNPYSGMWDNKTK